MSLEASTIVSAQSNITAVLVNNKGLTQDAKALPCFSQYELFEHLTKAQNLTKGRIQQKLKALSSYLICQPESGPFTLLRRLLCQKTQQSPDFVKESKVLFDNVAMSLFAYAFKFRIELYTESSDRLSTQYYGLKDSYAIRILLTADSYVLLKKKCKKSLRLVCSSPIKAAVKISTQQAKSVDTSFEVQSPVKINRDSSADTRSSSTDQNITTSIDNKSLDSSFMSDTKNDNNNKQTGFLKFYNESKEYGFIIMEDQSEIFVHKGDLVKQNIDTRYLAYYKQFYDVVIEFTVQEYKGKGKTYRKAVDLAIKEMITIAK